MKERKNGMFSRPRCEFILKHRSDNLRKLTLSVSLCGIEIYLVHTSLNDGKLFIVTLSELVADAIQHTDLQAHYLKLVHINPRPVTHFRFHILRSENSFFIFF